VSLFSLTFDATRQLERGQAANRSKHFGLDDRLEFASLRIRSQQFNPGPTASDTDFLLLRSTVLSDRGARNR
jgi:hypothetical protein